MIKEIDPEILKRLPRSFQIFYGYLEEAKNETQASQKVPKKDPKKSRRKG